MQDTTIERCNRSINERVELRLEARQLFDSVTSRTFFLPFHLLFNLQPPLELNDNRKRF